MIGLSMPSVCRRLYVAKWVILDSDKTSGRNLHTLEYGPIGKHNRPPLATPTLSTSRGRRGQGLIRIRNRRTQRNPLVGLLSLFRREHDRPHAEELRRASELGEIFECQLRCSPNRFGCSLPKHTAATSLWIDVQFVTGSS